MKRCWCLLSLLFSPGVYALEALSDTDLSQVAGRDGLSAEFRSSGISADQVNWVTDDAGLNNGSCTGGAANQHACTLANQYSLAPVSGDYMGSLEIDVGVEGGDPKMRLAADWGLPGQPLQATLGGLTLNTSTWNGSANSLGSFALQSTGSFTLVNTGGLLNSAAGSARLDLQTSNDLIYRQGPAGSPELSFSDLTFDLLFSNGAAAGHSPGSGRVMVDSSGFLIGAPNVLVDLTFDLGFKEAPTNFDTTGRSDMLRFGWQGGLVNASQRIGSGGFGYNSYLNGPNTFQDYDGAATGSRSQGFNLLSEWDFDTDFALVIGEASGNGTYARFTNWQTLGAPGPMFSFPVIFDVIQAGNAPAGLCAGPFTSGVASQASCQAAGGEFFSSGLDAGESAFAVLVRDAHLHAYSTLIQVEDPLAGGTVTPVNWGLLFTYGKMDADIFIHPQGRADGAAVTTTNTGIRADVTLLAQSPDAWRRANSSSAAVRATAGDGWRTNTHVMAVDTASPFGSGQNGVGFVNGDLLYRARDLFLRVTDGDAAYPDLPGGLWLQTDNFAQYRFRGIFGGGDLADLSYDALTKVSLLDVNLQTNRFIFVLNPLPVDGVTGAAPIGFNGLLDFDGGTYLTVGEVSSPSSQFFVRDVSGRIAWRDGSLAMISGENTASGSPQLVIKNELDIGASAGFGAATPGDPLVGTLGFGTEDFGRIAIPEGTWGSEIILEIPN